MPSVLGGERVCVLFSCFVLPRAAAGFETGWTRERGNLPKYNKFNNC